MKNIYRSLSIGILSVLLLDGCYKEKDYHPGGIDALEVMPEFYSSPLAIFADGVSTAKIIVRVNDMANDSLSAITLTTDAGMFLPSRAQSVIVYPKWNNTLNQNVAMVILQSVNTDTLANLVATIGRFQREMKVNYNRVYPDRLVLTIPDSLSFTHGFSKELNISVAGIYDKGRITLGDTINLSVVDSESQKPIGYFRNYYNLSDSSGRWRFTYTLGNTNWFGTLKVVATTTNTNKQSISSFQYIHSIY